GIIDKLLLTRCVRDSTAYMVVLIIVQQLFNLAIIAWQGVEVVYPWSLLALLAGGLQVGLWYSYLKALQVEEVSRVTSLVFVYPLFVFLGAALLLGESLTTANYLGGLLLVSSAMLVSRRPSPAGPLAFSPAVKPLIVFWIAASAYAIAAKHLLLHMDEWQLILWSAFGNLALVLPFLIVPRIREEVFIFSRQGARVMGAVLLEETFDLAGRAGMIFAFALGSVGLVSSVSALQPLMVLLYVVVLSIFVPGLLEEELDRHSIMRKLAAVVMVSLGIYLIS
ncbi:MAG: EamA family transporter, partial [Methanosarcinales archaeon]|nr:EamA family transporter [Methanosarcinales archaeon]